MLDSTDTEHVHHHRMFCGSTDLYCVCAHSCIYARMMNIWEGWIAQECCNRGGEGEGQRVKRRGRLGDGEQRRCRHMGQKTAGGTGDSQVREAGGGVVAFMTADTSRVHTVCMLGSVLSSLQLSLIFITT